MSYWRALNPLLGILGCMLLMILLSVYLSPKPDKVNLDGTMVFYEPSSTKVTVIDIMGVRNRTLIDSNNDGQVDITRIVQLGPGAGYPILSVGNRKPLQSEQQLFTSATQER